MTQATARCRSVLAALLCTLATCAATGQAVVYRCSSPGGGAAFQDKPCTGDGGAVELAAPNVVPGFDFADPLLHSARVRAAIERGAIVHGMTADEVVRARGQPERYAIAVDAEGGQLEELVYRLPDGRLRVTLQGGQVTAAQLVRSPAIGHTHRSETAPHSLPQRHRHRDPGRPR
mgnify:CR=1 FL=1